MSRIDVTATLAMLALLMAVSIPACNSRRGAPRQLQCLNNMRNIAIGVHNYASGRGGAMPSLDDGTYGWPIRLLPYTDSAAVYREYMDKSKTKKTQLWLEYFTCPEDPNNFKQEMGLSYVANAGYGNFTVNSQTGTITEVGTHTADIDWNDDGTIDESDRAVSRASGVFWRPHEDGFEMTLDYIEQADGLGQTIMLTENLNARNWASRETMDIAFVIGRSALGTGLPADSGMPLQMHTKDLGAFGINSNDGTLPGQSPVPSANHHGTINTAFCDGRAQSTSESIDPRVYARLMTPDGATFGQAKLKLNEY